ncbi:2-desacetyl-2-hydroxyethyl bacteriochlorophyllide A dehydrogenase [Motilibacter peucedani]|uniref:2-desacetyl-2-hydroxyethyl bacteriochlorophyllide A dehydrogenase n=1 Tax=Motilibacter peucedani TaxID=598650 RepID=A0A420XJR9_9ACTN|nr:alcohol dehydrogenase catalytic domain-containing protein [Motilibacter peucedani]RKS67972.1 2-desacetyl-2-hydroxyethyl bacteriochlorophyllide A dehydrogenase [Motilibacter peucedani]
MRALVLTGPRAAEVVDVDPPSAGPRQAVVDVERVGVCGTDHELWTGEMTYLHSGQASYPLRPGHEWCGVVSAVGSSDDEAWLGRRVTGDTMLGCGRCSRCLDGRQHVCEDRYEVGIRHGWHGALAEQLLMPVGALRTLPAAIDATAGALVEPGANAVRAVRATGAERGRRVLVWGPGTIGLLCAQFALASGMEVHVAGVTAESLELARGLGVTGTWPADELPALPFDAMLDASNGAEVPARALELVEPGGRVVCIGLASRPSLVDTRAMVLKDVTTVGVLSGSGGFEGAIEHYADGRVDPRPLVAATVGLDGAAAALAGQRLAAAGRGPKIHIDPRL